MLYRLRSGRQSLPGLRCQEEIRHHAGPALINSRVVVSITCSVIMRLLIMDMTVTVAVGGGTEDSSMSKRKVGRKESEGEKAGTVARNSHEVGIGERVGSR